MSDREKVNTTTRRNIVLAVLSGEETQADMARRYGLSRGRISRMLKEVQTNPESALLLSQARLEDAKEEVAFRRAVVYLLNVQTLNKQ